MLHNKRKVLTGFAFIFCLLLLPLLLIADPRLPVMKTDSFHYLNVGENWAEGRGLVCNFVLWNAPPGLSVPLDMRAPLLPYLIGIQGRIFSPVTPRSACLWLIAAHVLLCMALLRFSRNFHSEWLRVLLFIWAGAGWSWLTVDTYLLTDGLFAALTIAAIAWTVGEKPSAPMALLFAALAGITRFEGVFTLFVAGLILLWNMRFRDRKRIAITCGGIALACMPIFAWMIRNKLLLHDLSGGVRDRSTQPILKQIGLVLWMTFSSVFAPLRTLDNALAAHLGNNVFSVVIIIIVLIALAGLWLIARDPLPRILLLCIYFFLAMTSILHSIYHFDPLNIRFLIIPALLLTFVLLLLLDQKIGEWNGWTGKDVILLALSGFVALNILYGVAGVWRRGDDSSMVLMPPWAKELKASLPLQLNEQYLSPQFNYVTHYLHINTRSLPNDPRYLTLSSLKQKLPRQREIHFIFVRNIFDDNGQKNNLYSDVLEKFGAKKILAGGDVEVYRLAMK